MRRPGLMVPHVSVSSVSDIDYVALKKQKIDAVVFDKDNTLTAPYENTLHPKATRGIESALQVFGDANVAILSNSAGTNDDPDYRDALAIEEALQIKVIRHKEKKPGGLKEMLHHFSMLEKDDDNDDPSRICVVGDRLLTDVVFGNLHGMLTIHTLPLCVGAENRKDNVVAKLIRRMENRLLYSRMSNNDQMPQARAFWQQRMLPHKNWNVDNSVTLRDVD
uniref:Uncharacterized protein n=1 Tax=Cyclophora tenuis TaxID=216820 RepID=A0A7S1D5Y6_CYCTE